MEELDSVSASLHFSSMILAQGALTISGQFVETECGVLLPSNPVAVRLQRYGLYVPVRKEGAGEM